MSTKAKTKIDNSNPDVIPTKERLAYGIGALMDGGGVALMSCVMVKYMTNLGIAMGIASTIFMIAKLWDAITDPLMGFITDNTRSKYGRRKPYLFWGGVSLLFAIFLLFAPIREWGMGVGGAIAYIIIFYLVWNTCSTITQVPYCSLASDISPDHKQRNGANTFKLVFSAAAAGLSYVIPLFLLEATQPSADGTPASLTMTEFWIIISTVFGLLFGGGLVISGIFVKERITPDMNVPVEKFNIKKFIESYAIPFKNKSFRWHITMYATAFMCADMISALAVYYATDVWAGQFLDLGFMSLKFSSMLIVAPLMVMAVVAFPIVRTLMVKKSKQYAFRIGLPCYIVGGIMLAVMDPSWTPPIVVPIVAAIMGLGFGGAQMMPWIIFPDTVDVAEMATGERPTGTYSGIMTLIRKVAGALGVGMVGWIIDACGYQEAQEGVTDYIVQTDGALLAIKLVLGISVAFFITIAFLASFRYKINDKKLDRARYFIDKVKSEGIDSLNEEEAAERNALVAELYGKTKQPVAPIAEEDIA
ncbi:MAG: MFS transporter [Clostridia bacterium]|nr:MFS transporter [Clostridia bacterium]